MFFCPQASASAQPYPLWTLVVAFFLAIASLVPIAAIALLRMCGFRVFRIEDKKDGSSSNSDVAAAAAKVVESGYKEEEEEAGAIIKNAEKC